MTVLPKARGPLSSDVLGALANTPGGRLDIDSSGLDDIDPFGDDLHLALHVCYELHYQGLDEVDPAWEWDPELLRVRAALEKAFLAGLRAQVAGGSDVEAVLDELLVEPVDGGGLSHYLAEDGQWWQLREFFAIRSIYHLKEADPHAWVIPRLRGQAKAGIVAVEFDEFGGGRAEWVHSQLFADLLTDAGLSAGYLDYLDQAPACGLATVNFMSLCGLHRSLRGALVGHFAAAEITTAPSAQRLDKGLRRLDASERCRLFYTEHVEADAVHEQVLRNDVVGGLLADEPHLAPDVVFGVQATDLLESRLAEHLMTAWRDNRSALRATS